MVAENAYERWMTDVECGAMRRLLSRSRASGTARLVLAVTIVAGVLGVVACGGPDKPPLTPDNEMSDGIDGGAG
jgi:hypothetical protein